MFDNLRADLNRALRQARPPEWKPTLKHRIEVLLRHASWPVLAYRYSRACQRIRVPVMRQLLLISGLIFRTWVEVFTSVHIDPGADIGPGFVVHAAYAIHLGRVKIGKNFTISSGVLIAHTCRGIGDNVYFAAGAKLVGDAKIGNSVVVAANSVVLTEVRDNLMVMGVPARIKLPGGRPMQFFAVDRSSTVATPLRAPAGQSVKSVVAARARALRKMESPEVTADLRNVPHG